ncbi:MAG: peroxiredoxin Q/BCP [Pseudohongiellaceae bacterium]
MIVGVSFDEVADNCAFAEKYGFPYQLLCDTDRSMSMAYGACAKADAKYPGRVTYVIDKNGKIEWAETVTDIDAHVQTALAQLSGG